MESNIVKIKKRKIKNLKRTPVKERKVKEIVVVYGKTISKDFNSVKIHFGVTREMGKEEDYTDAIREELETLKTMVEGETRFC